MHNTFINIPNFLTWSRIALIPIFILVFYLPYKWSNIACTIIFSLASITDWLDGYLARKLNQVSDFGAFLDPVADKLMVAVALVLLVEKHPTPWLSIPAIVIVGREIAISALREWMAELGKRALVKVSFIGKFKTTMQIIAILFLLYGNPLFFIPVYEVGIVCLYIAAILTLWSMVIYLQAARRYF